MQTTAAPRVGLACLLLVVSTVAWRRGDVFEGSLDPVVVGKALCSVVALLLALFAAPRGAARYRLGTGSLWFLGIVLVASLLGAHAYGTSVPSIAIAVRVTVLAATVVLLLRAAPAFQLLRAVVASCGLVAAVAALTGLPDLAGGRIAGGIPPLHPNGLALLAGVVVVWAAWRTVLGEARWLDALLGGGFLALMWLTGSRTGFLVLVLAVLVMVLHIRRIRVGLVVGALVAAAAGAVTVVTTGAVRDFLTRDGTGTGTLESRFVAWTAAQSWAESWWQWTFGGGLSVKYIPVPNQWWDEQLLDSSWVSALVQTGLLGLGVTMAWALWALVGSVRAPRPHRVLFLGLLTFILGRSLLESGLVEATPEFLLFLAVALLAEGGSRARLRAEADLPATLPPNVDEPGAARALVLAPAGPPSAG
ncbi:O-antigen ligase family protein [Blastococcus sp. CCUG 61487]|uniref:O-antigen ligase family protein n=1 Tax=Blastococcus sp. CCUG 61487 TaxID=1840703 RepID=UPI001BAE6E10|nr:O-antigen ligase family protein [Blastococcus sp. CCUG 61487]